MISESSILNCFQHLVDFDRDDLVIVGSGDDAAVIKSQEKDLVHSIDISKNIKGTKNIQVILEKNGEHRLSEKNEIKYIKKLIENCL